MKFLSLALSFLSLVFFAEPLLAAPLDSCSLVTSEELAEILKAKVGPAVPVAEPRPHCTFAVEGKGMLKTVAIWAYPDHSRAGFDNGKIGLAPIQTVSGLGDEAYFGTSLMNVLKGLTYLQVQLIFPKGVPVQEVTRKIAEKAVSRLP